VNYISTKFQRAHKHRFISHFY